MSRRKRCCWYSGNSEEWRLLRQRTGGGVVAARRVVSRLHARLVQRGTGDHGQRGRRLAEVRTLSAVKAVAPWPEQLPIGGGGGGGGDAGGGGAR